MRRGLGLVALVAMVVLGFLAWRWLFPPDEVVIRKMVRAAAAAVSWEQGAGNFSRLAAANRLVGLCTPEIEILLDARGAGSERVQGRDALRQAIVAVRSRAAWLQVAVEGVELMVSESKDSATVLLAAAVRAEGTREPVLLNYKLSMRKVGGEWLIDRVEPVRGYGQ
jgi:hypothetical protein